MNPVDIIKNARADGLTDRNGDPVDLELFPGLDEEELFRFESSLPCGLPREIRDLLRFCSGFEGAFIDRVDLTGQVMDFNAEAIFPHGIPFASDGYGNSWVIDLSPGSKEFGPIWYACHDPPIILYQSPGLSDFLTELFKKGKPPHTSLIDEVHADSIRRVWRTNPDVQYHRDCLNSSDAVLREFAESLDSTHEFIDLRSAEAGHGFAWGRYGPGTVVKRHGHYPVFAYQRKLRLL
jgi:hypothetical protein